MLSDKLKRESIAWSIDFLTKYGADNILPYQFEYEIIKQLREEVADFLSTRELGSYTTSDFFSCLMPKNEKGFRVCTQLNPYDLIIYTAVVYESAIQLELTRIPPEKLVVFSYRLNSNLETDLFQAGEYESFQTQSAQILESGECSHMVSTDISDFYNQIYHHDVTNALLAAGIDKNRAEHFEKMLGNFTNQQSRGIPVGPTASHLIAEACLSDVDHMLLRKGYKYVRYVDDFRIFTKSKGEAIKAIHDLTEYLYSVHKLVLNTGKTHILTIEAAKKHIEDPKKQEEQQKIERAQEIIDNELPEIVIGEYEDPEELLYNYYEEITQRVETVELENIILELFKKGVEGEEADFRYVKYALTKAKLIRTPLLLDHVLTDLEKIAPVFQHVIKYLIKVTSEENRSLIGKSVSDWFEASEYKKLPFIQIWFLHLLTEHKYLDFKKAMAFCESSHDDFKGRYSAILAQRYGSPDWIRENRMRIDGDRPSMRRAFIWSAGILPADEYKHFQRSIKTKYGLESLEAKIGEYNLKK